MVSGAVCGLVTEDVDQTADLVDGQPDHVRVFGLVCGGGLGGADREDGQGCQGKGGEPVPGVPAADLVLVESDLVLAGLETLLSVPPVMYLNQVILAHRR